MSVSNPPERVVPLRVPFRRVVPVTTRAPEEFSESMALMTRPEPIPSHSSATPVFVEVVKEPRVLIAVWPTKLVERSSVGLPDAPSPLVTVRRLLVPVIVRPVNVSAAVWTKSPLLLNAASIARAPSGPRRMRTVTLPL